MPGSTDLADRLDAAIDHPAAPLPTDPWLRAGRRALRRRRTLAAAAAAAVVAVLGGGAVAVLGGADPAAPTPATTTDADDSADDPAGVVRVAEDARPAVRLEDGRLEVAAGVELLEVVPDPLGLAPAGSSFGVAWQRDGEPRWELHADRGDGTSSVAGGTVDGTYPDFGLWLDGAVQRELSGGTAVGTDGDPDFVRFGDGEQLVPLPGVEVLEQSADVDLPASFAEPGVPSAVALVRDADGLTWWVLARRLPGSPPEYIPYPGSAAATVDDFLALAASQYEGGAGLR